MKSAESSPCSALRRWRWLLLPLCLAVVAFLFVVNPTDYAWTPKCTFRQLTGFDCPGCGFQRAAHAMLHGRWAEAWAYNRFLIYALPFLACIMAAEWWPSQRVRERLRRIFEGRVALVAYLVLYVAWGVWRNVAGI